MMKTAASQLVVYGETTGGPVCLCSLNAAKQWLGSDQAGTLYWEVIEQLGTRAFFRYNQAYAFFTSETGNFALFRSDESLALVEVVSLEEGAVIPWQGIAFSIRPQTHAAVLLQGFTCFFDASRTIQGHILAQESIYATHHSKVWNTVVLECDYQAVCDVTYQSATLHLEGICFLKNKVEP